MGNSNDEFIRWANDTSQVAALLPSKVVLSRVLTAGGQGLVFLGTVDAADAAIKVYFPGQIGVRVRREIDLLAELDTPSIVRLLWHGQIDYQGQELPVVATAFIPGTDVAARLKEGPLTTHELVSVAEAGAAAIDVLWARRIVHRDIKPQNIMLSNERACVIDLGLARHLDQSSLTGAGMTWGTWGYFSPEQARGVRMLTCKSDIYSLGVTLLQGVLGRHPTGGDQLQLLARRLGDNPPGALVQSPLNKLIGAMLREKAPQRPMPKDILSSLDSLKGAL